MKRKRISKTIDNISLKYIEEAADYKGETTKYSSKVLLRWFSVAACFVLIIAVILSSNVIANKKLPMLELGIDNTGGMSFEGYFLKEVDDFLCDNPWNNQLFLSKLPVYSNIAYDEKGTPCALIEKRLEEWIRIAADKSDTTVTNITKSYANDLYGGYEEDFVYAITAETADGEIVANAAGGLTIIFNDPISLPFDFDNGNRAQGKKATEYFSNNFSALISEFIDFEKPAFAISYDYNAYKKIVGKYIAYDSADNRIRDILNYNLQYVNFQLDESGNLLWINICNSFCGVEKMGDYPIVSVNKAKSELEKGNYISSYLDGFPGKEYIADVELVYTHGKRETVAPYYRFIVELPETPSLNEEIKNYGSFYVPAIREEYISEIILYDGILQ